MAVVFEKLAAQLQDPLFRTAESGYDPDDVRAVLDEAAARLAVLEARLAKAEARAAKAQRRLAQARRKGVRSDSGVLDQAVFDGQRRAEQIKADALAEVKRLRDEAVAAVAAAQASTDLSDLRSEVDEQRVALRRAQETCDVARADLDAVDRAVRAARAQILTGLEEQLRQLAVKEAVA